jgi:hypothetical protein
MLFFEFLDLLYVRVAEAAYFLISLFGNIIHIAVIRGRARASTVHILYYGDQ